MSQISDIEETFEFIVSNFCIEIFTKKGNYFSVLYVLFFSHLEEKKWCLFCKRPLLSTGNILCVNFLDNLNFCLHFRPFFGFIYL